MINKLKSRGFTLVETLIAVFILSTAITGPLTIASRGLNTALIAKNQITAFYLAQDALEYLRFSRDTNTLSGGDWLTGAGGTGSVIDLTNCVSANGCFLDSTSQSPLTPTACGSACSTPLGASSKYLNYSSTGFFWYGAGTKQPFVRKITLTQINTTEYLLTVNVYWNDIGVTHTVSLNENLFSWQ